MASSPYDLSSGGGLRTLALLEAEHLEYAVRRGC